MEQNFVGYLLNALEPDDRAEVETYLSTHPEAHRQLDLLRQTLEPLGVDRPEPAVPAGLANRTLTFVAEHWGQALPRSPDTPNSRSLGFPRGGWRRADTLMAACLLIVVGGLSLPAVGHVRALHERIACQKNLQDLFVSLKQYGDRHGQRLPDVAAVAKPPKNVAGMVVPLLVKSGHLAPNQRLDCPGNPGSHVRADLDYLLGLDDETFRGVAPNLAPCYGYTLGYRNGEGRYHGMEFKPDPAGHAIPIVADRPPLNPANGNSPNHGGRGQNVLYIDGSFRFCTDRRAGPDGDDIYLNRAHRPEAGHHLYDSVIGASDARP